MFFLCWWLETDFLWWHLFRSRKFDFRVFYQLKVGMLSDYSLLKTKKERLENSFRSQLAYRRKRLLNEVFGLWRANTDCKRESMHKFQVACVVAICGVDLFRCSKLGFSLCDFSLSVWQLTTTPNILNLLKHSYS